VKNIERMPYSPTSRSMFAMIVSVGNERIERPKVWLSQKVQR